MLLHFSVTAANNYTPARIVKKKGHVTPPREKRENV
jgi:hypothetical protein